MIMNLKLNTNLKSTLLEGGQRGQTVRASLRTLGVFYEIKIGMALLALLGRGERGG